MTSDSLACIAVGIDPLIVLGAPCDQAALAAAEAKLGIAFPPELRELLTEADGATVRIRLSDGEVVPASELYWTVAEIVYRNLAAGAPTAAGLWFADVGADGMLFGHRRSPNGSVEQPVVVWMPLDHEVVQVAATIREWITGWLEGTIEV